MKKTFTYLSAALFLTIGLKMNSQGVEWLKKYELISNAYSDIAPRPNGDMFVSVSTPSGTSTYDTYTLNCASNYNFNISKIDPSGNVSLVKNFGDQSLKGDKINVDALGNIICSGTYTGTVVFDTYTLSGGCGFLCKLNSSGTVQWAQSLGISPSIMNNQSALCTDQTGNIYCSGNFAGTITAGSFSAASGLSYAGFIAKFDPNGGAQWLQGLGGTKNRFVEDINLDVSGNVYAVGSFSQTCAFGSYSLTSAGDYDSFLWKLNNNGGVLWAKQYGYWTKDYFQSVSLTNSDKMYLTGGFNYTTIIGTNTLTNNFGTPNYVAKMDTAGNVIWTKQFAATTGTFGAFITGGITDGSDDVYITGIFQGTLVCFGSASVSASCLTSSVGNGFVSKLDGNGNYLWVKHIKSNVSQGSQEIRERNGKVFVSGSTNGISTTTSVDNYSVTGTGNGYNYYLRLNPAVIGLTEFEDQDKFKTYPNPVSANGVIVFEDLISTKNSVIIADITGKQIVNTDLLNSKLSLSNYNLSPGVYILKVNSDSQYGLVKKIIIE